MNAKPAQATPPANSQEGMFQQGDVFLRQQPAEQYLSLIIRIWWGGREGHNPAIAWRSEVEHIQSSKRWSFSDPVELDRFLTKFLEQALYINSI